MKRTLLIALSTTLVGAALLLAGYIYLFIYDGVAAPVEYDAQLSDFDWPNGAGLVHIRTAGNSDEVGIKPGNYIKSTDGKIEHYAGDNWGAYERLSPIELLIADGDELFFITPEEITTIESNGDALQYLSLAPSKQYLKYGSKLSICLAAFNFTALGECKKPVQEIPDDINWDTHFIEGEWDAEDNVYIMRVRSTEVHDLVEPDGPNMPPKRVQKEVARYAYNLEANTLAVLDLNSEISLKGKKAFLTDENRTDPIEAGGYKVISDEGGHTLGIEQISTGKKAKLMDAPYFGDMPGFDRW